ncbi:MAG: hypothetical protein OHK0057_25110 [Thermoflexibacter sp.]
MKKLIYLFCLVVFFFTNSCKNDSTEDLDVQIPLNEIWVSVNGALLKFRTDGGVFPEASSGYLTNIKFLSIFRTISAQDRRSMHIRATFDVDNIQTPTNIVKDIKITYTTLQGGQRTYDGQGSDIAFKLLDIKGDIIKASFSGTLYNTANRNDKVEIRNGSMNVPFKRY